jgi:hypothetical protein
MNFYPPFKLTVYFGLLLLSFKLNKNRFADGEINIAIKNNIRGADVFVIQPCCPPDVNAHRIHLSIAPLPKILKYCSYGTPTPYTYTQA